MIIVLSLIIVGLVLQNVLIRVRMYQIHRAALLLQAILEVVESKLEVARKTARDESR